MNLKIVCSLVIMQCLTQTIVHAEPTICTGPKKLFSKENLADPLLPENQDLITNNTKLTRQSTRGLFNINLENAYSSTSPANTLWAYGSATDFQTLTFTAWEQWHGKNPSSAIGRNAVIHIVDEELYLDVSFLSWTQGRGGGGGGVSYIRSTCNNILLDIKANGSDTLVTLTPTEALNLSISIAPDDRLGESADWWLLAATQSGMFYYDLSSNAWLPGITATFQGALFNIPTFTVSTQSGLPGGTYTFYFGFDDTVNGTLDLPNTLFDSIEVES